MKIKDGFILREVAGSFVVVAVGKTAKEFNSIINLNETGAFLFKLLQEGKDKEGLLKEMLNEYDVSKEVASKDIDAFLVKVTEAGLLYQ